MKPYAIKRTSTIEQALTLLHELGEAAWCVAGGTDVLIAMRHAELPESVTTLIDISGIAELSGVREEGDGIVLGAGTTHTDIEENTLLRSVVPLLADASRSVGSPQIRNRGTVGGNLVTSAQCADTIPPLMVLDAEVVLQSLNGSRRLPLAEFLTGPKQTAIAADELCTEIRFRKPPRDAVGYFHKLIRRQAVAKARISIAALARQDVEGRIRELRISPGSVTPKPQRFSSVEQLLEGQIATEKLIRTASREAVAFMVATTGRRWSTPYKEPVLQVLVRRALESVLRVERGE